MVSGWQKVSLSEGKMRERRGVQQREVQWKMFGSDFQQPEEPLFLWLLSQGKGQHCQFACSACVI